MASTITFEAGSTTTVTDFTLSGTAGNVVTINSSVFYPNIEYLVVAGGGGGGTGASINDYAGGGGAGGLINASYPTTGDTYTVTIGSGGSAGATNSNGTNGGNSSITTTSASIAVALGGGYGATKDTVGGNGGSGGGGGGYTAGSAGGIGTQPASASGGYGYDGGAGQTGSQQGSGGGGGAGGISPYNGQPGAGRLMTQFLAYGESGYFASGGAGVKNGSGGNANGKWQIGGGGGFDANGLWGGTSGVPRSAIAATGGGGAIGFPGASGIVIIRYPDSYPAATTTGSPTITVAGGYREYAWTTSGSITFTGSAGQATLSKSSGTVSVDYLSIQDSNATGGATWTAGANSVDAGNNTGWIFTAPPAPSTNTGNFFLFF